MGTVEIKCKGRVWKYYLPLDLPLETAAAVREVDTIEELDKLVEELTINKEFDFISVRKMVK